MGPALHTNSHLQGQGPQFRFSLHSKGLEPSKETLICLGPASWGSQAGPGLTVAGSVPHGPGCLPQTLATLPRLRLARPFPASPAPAACPSPSESQHPVCSFSHWSSRPVFLMAPCAGRWGTPPSLEGGGVPPGGDPHFPTEQERTTGRWNLARKAVNSALNSDPRPWGWPPMQPTPLWQLPSPACCASSPHSHLHLVPGQGCKHNLSLSREHWHWLQPSWSSPPTIHSLELPLSTPYKHCGHFTCRVHTPHSPLMMQEPRRGPQGDGQS